MEQQYTPGHPSADRMKARDLFNQIMKEVDVFIKQGKIHEATLHLFKAKELEPVNPYVKAFEERITILDKASKGKKQFIQHPDQPVVIPSGEVKNPVIPSKEPPKNIVLGDRSVLELKIRDQIETEYRDRYTGELRAAERKAALLLEQEQEKIKKQRELLRTHYEEGLTAIQKRLEAEYQTRLDQEVRLAEDRLRKQFEGEQSFFENEMKSTMALHYDAKLSELEDRLKQQQAELAAKEQTSLLEKDRLLKEQYNRKLLEELRKAESFIFQQSEQQQKLEEEKLRGRLTHEFEKKIKKEREVMAREFEARQADLKQVTEEERLRLKSEYERQLHEKLEETRKRELQEYEQKRAHLIQQMEAEHKRTYEGQLGAERERMRAENETALEAERQKFRVEREEMIAREEAGVRKSRQDLRTEMDKILIERLEQLQGDYERKIELLGISIPKTHEERLAFYAQRLAIAYTEGEPNVDQAGDLFELKELLELTYDEHVRLDSEVRLRQYLRALETGLKNGTLDLAASSSLDELKQKFHILPEEASQVEALMLSKMKQHVYRGTILLADDEDDIRLPLADTLQGEGYHVIACASVDEALTRLKSENVDLIVSDIKFGPHVPDGFKFFQTIQKNPALRSIPFIFLSSLNDNVIVRSGVELGVDDYLIKPVDPELLIAVIKGKLKRSRKA